MSSVHAVYLVVQCLRDIVLRHYINKDYYYYYYHYQNIPYVSHPQTSYGVYICCEYSVEKLPHIWVNPGYVHYSRIIVQAGKLKFFGTRPNWVVSYIAYISIYSEISNHPQLVWLLNMLSRLTTKKTWKQYHWPYVRGINQWFPTQMASNDHVFPCYDIIMDPGYL